MDTITFSPAMNTIAEDVYRLRLFNYNSNKIIMEFYKKKNIVRNL